MPQFCILCRAGFEEDAALELTRAMNAHGRTGRIVKKEKACVLWQDENPKKMPDGFHKELIFARQSFSVLEKIENLPAADRVTPIAAAIARHVNEFPERGFHILAEHPDLENAEGLGRFCTDFVRVLAGDLRKKFPDNFERGTERTHRLHVLFLDYATVLVGINPEAEGSRLRGGIVRLRQHPLAPSRSGLKLAEAIETLLTEDERKKFFRAGMRAVDLGAAPGGWTLQLLSMGLSVTAVDNAELSEKLATAGAYLHLKEDGFVWKPREMADWMVCDMVETPSKVAELMGEWLEEGKARRIIFNLKLPMKKRLEELDSCFESIRKKVSYQPMTLRCRHLYHDREEVTCCAWMEK